MLACRCIENQPSPLFMASHGTAISIGLIVISFTIAPRECLILWQLPCEFHVSFAVHYILKHRPTCSCNSPEPTSPEQLPWKAQSVPFRPHTRAREPTSSTRNHSRARHYFKAITRPFRQIAGHVGRPQHPLLVRLKLKKKSSHWGSY